MSFKAIFSAILLLSSFSIIFSQSYERDWYQVFDPQRAEATERKELIEKKNFFSHKDATTEDCLLVISITAGFDYEEYLISNEKKSLGLSQIELDEINTALIEDKTFKEKVVSWIAKRKLFNTQYANLKDIYLLRQTCISYIWYMNKGAQNEIAKNLNLEETNLYLSLKKLETNDRRYYFKKALQKFKSKSSDFFNKYDFKEISKANSPMAISDYLNLLLTDENFCKTMNIMFISSLMQLNKSNPIDIQLGTLIIKVWQKYKSLKVGLVDDPLLQGNLMGLLDDTLNLLKISDYQEHETILKELLTPELYKKVFIDHVKFLDIPEFVTAGRRALLYGHLHKQ